jgi:hypothetical protein
MESGKKRSTILWVKARQAVRLAGVFFMRPARCHEQSLTAVNSLRD